MASLLLLLLPPLLSSEPLMRTPFTIYADGSFICRNVSMAEIQLKERVEIMGPPRKYLR